MRVHIASFIKAIVNDVREREQIRLLIEQMEADPHTLDDIGLTLDEFAALQWQGHRTHGALHRHWQQLGWKRSASVLRDTLGFHRTPMLKS